MINSIVIREGSLNKYISLHKEVFSTNMRKVLHFLYQFWKELKIENYHNERNVVNAEAQED